MLIEPVSASHSQLTNLNLEQVSSDVLEGLISPLSTPNPGFFDHVTPLVADTLINDSSVESCPLALLSTQLLQPAAQPLELGLLHDTHVGGCIWLHDDDNNLQALKFLSKR